MSKLEVHYEGGFNNSGTGQHEVLESVRKAGVRCCTGMCIGICGGDLTNCPALKNEGPYVVLYTETAWAAAAVAAILNADGTDNNFPDTPMEQYKKAEAPRRHKSPESDGMFYRDPADEAGLIPNPADYEA